MKITIVSCLNKHCGIGRYTHELATGLHNIGENVIALRKDGGDESFIKDYPYRSLKQLRNYVAPYYLGNALYKLKSSIWHADYVNSAFALALAKKRGQRIITTAHDAIPFLYSSGLDRMYYKYMLKQADRISDAIVVVSNKSKEDLAYYGGVAPEKIHVIYNGINHDEFYPDSIKRRNRIFTIRYLGGLGKSHKNTHLLIEVANLLKSRGLKFRLEIGGGFAQSTHLPSLVSKYNLSEVHFAGFIADNQMRSFLAEADAFLYPSGYEGFGFPPLEAMACGTPTVSSNGGSLAEVLKDGALVSEPNVVALTDNLQRLMHDEELYESVRNQGLAVAKLYNWNNTVTQTLALYKQLN